MCQGIAQGRGQENRRLYDRQSRLTVQRDDLSWAKASETEGLSLRKRTINLILWIICLTLIFLTVVPLLLGYYMGPKITRQILEQEVQNLLQKKIVLFPKVEAGTFRKVCQFRHLFVINIPPFST